MTKSTAISNRTDIPHARRIVVKVGSSSISGPNAHRIENLVDALAAAHARGTEVVLVSSGAIATGIPFLGLGNRPTDLATQQAAAAVGQNVLIYRYQESLSRYGITAGQVLLTAGDLENETPRGNAEQAMNRLLELRILPIVNENVRATPILKNSASITQTGLTISKKIVFPNLYVESQVVAQLREILRISSGIIEVFDLNLTWRALLLDIGSFVKMNINVASAKSVSI